MIPVKLVRKIVYLIVYLSRVCVYFESKKLGNNPVPTENQKTYSDVGRNTNCSQTDIPGPPWFTSPRTRQKLDSVCKGPDVLAVHPRDPVNTVTDEDLSLVDSETW